MEMALAWLSAFVIGVGIAIAIVRIVRAPLERVLSEIFGIPSAAEFYARAFVLLIIVATGGTLLGPLFISCLDPKRPEPPHFMQYVWAVADKLNAVANRVTACLLAFVLIVAILVALGENRNWITKRS